MTEIYEQIPPETILPGLILWQKQLLKLRNEKLLEKNKAPAGLLRIIKNKGSLQYYHVTNYKLDKNGKYIAKKEKSLVCSLAQKEYNKKILRLLNNQIQKLEKCITALESNQISKLYDRLSAPYKELVLPVTLPASEYSRRWKSVTYRPKPFIQDTPEYYTASGSRVRSKSEIIIADSLDRLSIPYRYEFPVKLQNYTVHPDFYCLNLRSRQEFAWEHFGMMDDPEYSAKVTEKLNAYQKSGWFPGKNLIISMETPAQPLKSKRVEEIIKNYLL